MVGESTPERRRILWLRKGTVERVRQRFGILVTEIDGAGRQPARVG